VPPAQRRLGVLPHAADVSQRELELALQGPELVPALHLEPDPVSLDADLYH
jgi:hypothetical protein